MAGQWDGAAEEFVFQRAVDSFGHIAHVDDADGLVHDRGQAIVHDQLNETQVLGAKFPGAEAGSGIHDDGGKAIAGRVENGAFHSGFGLEVWICGAAPCSFHGGEWRVATRQRGEGADEDQRNSIAAGSIDHRARVAETRVDRIAPRGTAGNAGVQWIRRGGVNEQIVAGGKLGESDRIEACYGYGKTT